MGYRHHFYVDSDSSHDRYPIQTMEVHELLIDTSRENVTETENTKQNGIDMNSDDQNEKSTIPPRPPEMSIRIGLDGLIAKRREKEELDHIDHDTLLHTIPWLNIWRVSVLLLLLATFFIVVFVLRKEYKLPCKESPK